VVSFILKAFSNGMMVKNFAMTTETLKYALDANHVVVPQNKCIGQRHRKLQNQSVRQWLEELCNAFSCNDRQRTYQGDGHMDVEGALELAFLPMV
jgi:hypothetical protein